MATSSPQSFLVGLSTYVPAHHLMYLRTHSNITSFSTDKFGIHHWTPPKFFVLFTGFIIFSLKKCIIRHRVHTSYSVAVLYRTWLWKSYTHTAGTSAVTWAVSQPAWTPRPHQNVAMHCYIGTFFSHNKLFAYQHPPPQIWDKSADNSVWLPTWQGNRINMVTQAILSPHGKH